MPVKTTLTPKFNAGVSSPIGENPIKETPFLGITGIQQVKVLYQLTKIPLAWNIIGGSKYQQDNFITKVVEHL